MRYAHIYDNGGYIVARYLLLLLIKLFYQTMIMDILDI